MKISPFQSLRLFLLCLVMTPGLLQAEKLRTDTRWLAENLATPGLIILDARSEDDYNSAHIPGAISFPDALSYQDKQVSGLIVKPDLAQQMLHQRGIKTDSVVVIYDEGLIVKSARILWMLEVYGLKNVKILNGGFSAWQAEQLPVTTDIPEVTPSEYVVQINHNRIASKFTTELATLNPMQTVVDARPDTAYRGETSTAQRFGHIPTAINIPVQSNFSPVDQGDQTRFLLDREQLGILYQNLPRDGKIVIYCEAGTVSATNYLVLRELGYNVANYDASWREWGNDLSLPIEK